MIIVTCDNCGAELHYYPVYLGDGGMGFSVDFAQIRYDNNTEYLQLCKSCAMGIASNIRSKTEEETKKEN